MQRIATAHLKSLMPYSQSRTFSEADVPKKTGETADEYEDRTWRNKSHSMPDGRVLIPPLAFAGCLKTAAKRMGRKIAGRGQRTWTKHFEAGVLVLDPLVLPLSVDEVGCERIYAYAQGGKSAKEGRVWRNFPRIDSWEGDVDFIVVDDDINEEIFRETLEYAGSLVGIGRFRPENRGYFGRFAVQSVAWAEVKAA